MIKEKRSHEGCADVFQVSERLGADAPGADQRVDPRHARFTALQLARGSGPQRGCPLLLAPPLFARGAVRLHARTEYKEKKDDAVLRPALRCIGDRLLF